MTHAPPAVDYPVPASRWPWVLRAVLLVLMLGTYHALADARAAAWLQQLWLVVALLVWVAALSWGWRQRVGVLRWDGKTWSWRDHGQEVESAQAGMPVLAVDAQAVLLLQWHAGGSHRLLPDWLWLEQGTAPALWPDLRRALLASAKGTP